MPLHLLLEMKLHPPCMDLPAASINPGFLQQHAPIYAQPSSPHHLQCPARLPVQSWTLAFLTSLWSRLGMGSKRSPRVK